MNDYEAACYDFFPDEPGKGASAADQDLADAALVEPVSPEETQGALDQEDVVPLGEMPGPLQELPDEEVELAPTEEAQASEDFSPEEDTAAEAAAIASALHENWRQTRLQEDGSYEPRVKSTEDEAWVAAYGTDQVDVANTAYADLPEDRQAENKAAAEVVLDIIRETDGAIDLEDPAQRSYIGRRIHDAWLSRNDWARGSELDVPFDELPADEQLKDLNQMTVARQILGR